MSASAWADFSRFVAGMHAAREQMLRVGARAVETFAVMVVGVAQNLAPVGGPPYSPNDPAPGTLQGSGTWEPAQIDGTQITVNIGFNTDYAAVQHERLDFRHSVGQAKYLETAMRRNEGKFVGFVAGKLEGAGF